MKTINYGLSKIIDLEYNKAITKVIDELKAEGFGVLTEIDVKQTMKTKLDVDMKPYKILGACNPVFAHRALSLENQIGLMLPCNVIVYVDDNNRTVVSVVDPVAAMSAANNPALMEIAEEIKQKLNRVINQV